MFGDWERAIQRVIQQIEGVLGTGLPGQISPERAATDERRAESGDAQAISLRGSSAWRNLIGMVVAGAVIIVAVLGGLLAWQMLPKGATPTAYAPHRGRVDLTGKSTTSLGSTLTLSQNQNQVSGTSCCRPGHPNWSSDVSGTFDGATYVGTFRWREGNEQGEGTFGYTFKGNRLEGIFRSPRGTETPSLLIRQ